MGQPLRLAESDLKQFEELLGRGVLKKINAEMLRKIDRNGIVSFGCCDGDQFDDKREHFQRVFGSNCRIHPPSLPGGPVILSHQLLKSHRPTAIWAIKVMLEKKRVHTVGLCSHAPCAMAMELGLDFNGVIKGLTEAKRLLRKQLVGGSEIEILRFVHVDRTPFGKHKGTYFVDNHES